MRIDKSLRIGILYDSVDDINDFINSLPGNFNHEYGYHWREPEEIQAISTALEQLGHDVIHIGSLENLLLHRRSFLPIDLAWNVSIRAISRNRTSLAPALLELMQIPYTGGDLSIKSFTLNKDFLKPFLQNHGVLTPDWVEIDHDNFTGFPPDWNKIIVKPAAEGYSLGIKVFNSQSPIKEVVGHTKAVFQQLHQRCIAEEFICGREIHVSIIDGMARTGLMETRSHDGSKMGARYLDTHAKRSGHFTKAVPAVDEPGIQQAIVAARSLAERLGPLDYATFDFRINDAGDAYLIDVNADATLHPERTLARSFQMAGLEYNQLIGAICHATLRRWSNQDFQQITTVNLS